MYSSENINIEKAGWFEAVCDPGLEVLTDRYIHLKKIEDEETMVIL
jgi:hypothetical protein